MASATADVNFEMVFIFLVPMFRVSNERRHGCFPTQLGNGGAFGTIDEQCRTLNSRAKGDDLWQSAAVHVAGGGIAANQVVDACSRRDGAADAGRRRPDHLGIVPDVFSIAAATVVREYSGHEVALLRCPAADHRLDAECPVRA